MTDKSERPLWLLPLVEKINELRRQSQAMEFFRRNVRQFGEDQKKRYAECRKWRKKREAHEKRVLNDPLLQDIKTAPPKKGWVIEEFIIRNEETKSNWETVSGWFPLKLKSENDPYSESLETMACDPLGLGPVELLPLPTWESDSERNPHEYTIAEMCVVLAALGDWYCPNAKQTDPWHDLPEYDPRVSKPSGPGLTYRLERSRASQICEADLVTFQEFFTEVQRRIEAEIAGSDSPVSKAEQAPDSLNTQSASSPRPLVGAGGEQTESSQKEIPPRAQKAYEQYQQGIDAMKGHA